MPTITIMNGAPARIVRFSSPSRAAAPPPPIINMIAATEPIRTPQNTTIFLFGSIEPRCDKVPVTMDAASAPDTKKIATRSMTRTLATVVNGKRSRTEKSCSSCPVGFSAVPAMFSPPRCRSIAVKVRRPVSTRQSDTCGYLRITERRAGLRGCGDDDGGRFFRHGRIGPSSEGKQMPITPTILATSGGFEHDARGLLVPSGLVKKALELSGAERPKLCFIGTASGDATDYIQLTYAAFAGWPVDVSHLALFPMPNVDDIRAHIMAQDVVWVGGGSVAGLLVMWRLHGLDDVMREAWHEGVVLAGVSARSICWHTGGPTDSFGPQLRGIPNGLGLVPFGNGVHYD